MVLSYHSHRGNDIIDNRSKVLGHKTVVMISRYVKMSETRLREAFTKMSDVMKRGRETKQE